MNDKFYAVFVENSYHVPGDERSKTHPGHGYPAETVKYTEVIEFQNADDLRRWIFDNHDKKKYRAVKCNPVFVSAQVQVSLDGI